MTIMYLSRGSITTTVPSILIKIPLQITPRITIFKISARAKKNSNGANLLSCLLVKASHNSNSHSYNNNHHLQIHHLCLRHLLFLLVIVLLINTKEIKANSSKMMCQITWLLSRMIISSF